MARRALTSSGSLITTPPSRLPTAALAASLTFHAVVAIGLFLWAPETERAIDETGPNVIPFELVSERDFLLMRRVSVEPSQPPVINATRNASAPPPAPEAPKPALEDRPVGRPDAAESGAGPETAAREVPPLAASADRTSPADGVPPSAKLQHDAPARQRLEQPETPPQAATEGMARGQSTEPIPPPRNVAAGSPGRPPDVSSVDSQPPPLQPTAEAPAPLPHAAAPTRQTRITEKQADVAISEAQTAPTPAPEARTPRAAPSPWQRPARDAPRGPGPAPAAPVEPEPPVADPDTGARLIVAAIEVSPAPATVVRATPDAAAVPAPQSAAAPRTDAPRNTAKTVTTGAQAAEPIVADPPAHDPLGASAVNAPAPVTAASAPSPSGTIEGAGPPAASQPEPRHAAAVLIRPPDPAPATRPRPGSAREVADNPDAAPSVDRPDHEAAPALPGARPAPVARTDAAAHRRPAPASAPKTVAPRLEQVPPDRHAPIAAVESGRAVPNAPSAEPRIEHSIAEARSASKAERIDTPAAVRQPIPAPELDKPSAQASPRRAVTAPALAAAKAVGPRPAQAEAATVPAPTSSPGRPPEPDEPGERVIHPLAAAGARAPEAEPVATITDSAQPIAPRRGAAVGREVRAPKGAIGGGAPAEPAPAAAPEVTATAAPSASAAGEATRVVPARDAAEAPASPLATGEHAPRDKVGERLAALPRPEQGQADLGGVRHVLGSVACGHVSARHEEGRNTLMLDGFVPDATSKNRLRVHLQRLTNGIAVSDSALRIVPRPLCDALTAVVARGAKIGDGAGRMDRYVDGESITFSVTSPPYPAFVYIDYYTLAGIVHHLMPSRFRLKHRFAPHQTVTIGKDDGMTLRVRPPYGTEMVMVLATSAKLFDEPRPLTEPIRAYLDPLKTAIDALKRRPKGRISYTYLLIEVAPKRSDLAQSPNED